MSLLWLFLILFVVVDFFFPIPALSEQETKRNRKPRWGWFLLPLGYALPTALLAPLEKIWIFLPIYAIHVCALVVKVKGMKRAQSYGRLILYLLYHLLFGIAAYNLLVITGLDRITGPFVCPFGNPIFSILTEERNLFGVLVFLYACFTGAQLMRLFLDVLYRKVSDYGEKLYPEGEKRTEITNTVMTGTMIGILERALIFLFVISNNLSAIPFILAAKSLARFKQLNDRDFAEYYLIGTLFSVLIALCGGFIVRLSS